MDKLLIALCEDDEAERGKLEQIIADDNRPCDIESFPDGESFLTSFYPGKYDLIFLDIYMGKIGGIDVAGRVRAVDPHVPIAFVTTSTDHALDGYRLHVDRYLEKPIDPDDVSEALDLAAHRRDEAPGITIKVDRRDVAIPFKRIRYAEQRNHTVIYHLSGGQDISARGRLDSLEDIAPTPPFFRCHQSYLVNLEHVYRVNAKLNVFEMDEGDIAYIRRSSMREAKSAFTEFMLKATRDQ